MQANVAVVALTVLSAVAGVATWQEPASRPQPAIVEAARRFLEVLRPEQRALAAAPLGEPSRLQWNFVPQQYPGVMLGELDDAQRAAADALLRAVLSERGFAKVESVVALETVLRELESRPGHDAAHRDPRRYWLQVFGEPKGRGAFALRLQGHHVSLHFAVADGRLVAASPAFLGANPAAIPQGPHRGERVLGREEDLARGLLALLDDAQRARAVTATDAPADVVFGPGRALDGAGAPQGLSWNAMDALQRQLLWRIVEEYVRLRHREAADAELQRLEQLGRDAITFAWAGSVHRGRPHYWRIQGPTFVIEYDNTQNDANHVHTLYRDLQRDFGGDLLRAHHDRDHDHERGR